jgi:hypothetical protein
VQLVAPAFEEAPGLHRLQKPFVPAVPGLHESQPGLLGFGSGLVPLGHCVHCDAAVPLIALAGQAVQVACPPGE